jgi:hypothetical protein
MLTFWDRKNTGERVAQGSVRALMLGLNEFQYRRNYESKEGRSKERRPVRMLTVGHSFGGLIVFESLSAELLRSAALLEEASHEEFARRVGDLIVIANPAFEGTRYEPLDAASQKLEVKKQQLPTVIVATSTADWATGVAFPAARALSSVLERTPGTEYAANMRTVGHNAAYTTHTLDVCAADDKTCKSVCADEEKFVESLASEGLADGTQYLCQGLKLVGPLTEVERNGPRRVARGKAFMVVQTTGAIMKDHDDIFNPAFVAFIRQMYRAVLFARRD